VRNQVLYLFIHKHEIAFRVLKGCSGIGFVSSGRKNTMQYVGIIARSLNNVTAFTNAHKEKWQITHWYNA
jgi:hypothetical protein